MRTDWNPILRPETEKPYWDKLQQFVAIERRTHEVYPPHDQVFSAFHLTPFKSVRVLILGQDPYHGSGQANGLCFSVFADVPIPPSLRNIFKELTSDVGVPSPGHGSLKSWATQGVLLLNTTLTVRAKQAASHQKQGWERFTDEVISAVSAKDERVVFVLWGAAAAKKRELIDVNKHVIVSAPHPSPLSAHRGFFGSRPFSAINEALVESGETAIDWQIPSAEETSEEAERVEDVDQ